MTDDERYGSINEIIDTLQDLVDGQFGDGNDVFLSVDFDLRRECFAAIIGNKKFVVTEFLLTNQDHLWSHQLESMVKLLAEKGYGVRVPK